MYNMSVNRGRSFFMYNKGYLVGAERLLLSLLTSERYPFFIGDDMRICEIKECYKKHFGSGLCHAHYNRKRFKDNPWLKTWFGINNRCKWKKNNSYYKKGRKIFITKEDLKYLWFRDKAYLMKQPTIHRINNNGDYVLNNCQYIEMTENLAKRDMSIGSGENAGNHKLTKEQVEEIRKTYIPKKVSYKHLAKKYNVSIFAIYSIIKNKTWKE